MHATRSSRPTYLAAGLAVVIWLASPTASPAQQTSPESRPALVTVIDADGGGPDFDLRTLGRGFDLFGAGDAAVGGMRMTGNLAGGISNYGPCSNGFAWSRCMSELRVINPGVTMRAPFYEVEWAVAAPPTEYLKIRQVAPSVANATGGGWTAGTNFGVLGRLPRWGPADGTLGRMFSGVTTTTDGSCRDRTGFGNGYWGAGYQMLPVSDCPETWGSEGWQGARPIPQAGWEALLAQRGDGFRFDFWRVPAEYTREDEPSLGTGVHIYGETSDYSSDVLPYFGAVVPGGTGAPRHQGYPLGLLLHFDAFTFADPRMANAYFVQVLIINRSADVWGTGIDYDSLYLGFSNGTLFSTDNVSRYALPDRGTVLHHNNNVQGAGGPCDDAYRRPEGSGCSGNTYSLRGYGASGLAIMFLKSPLGDLRNKLFTRTVGGQPCQAGVDPFCRPGHPSAGDTLTFNHQNFGDYASALQLSWDNGVESAFGFLAGNEEATLAGRDPAGMPDRELWRGFRSEDWPGSSTLVGAPNKAHYNKYVPPASPPWDYDHDGIPDTLALATCGRYGCAVVDSDTMPGGFLNRRGNIGGHQSFGPFALAAGDTTALVYAMVGGGDSAEVWESINAALEAYLTFFASPTPPPVARVLSTTVTPGTDAFGTTPPEVRLTFSDDPARWVDPYLLQVADEVEGAAPGTPLATLRTLNDGNRIVVVVVDTLPGPVYDTTFITMQSTSLVNALRERAGANVARLEIYKSCDGGRTFTSDANCVGDPTADVNGVPIGLGWEAYASLPVGGQPMPTVFTDANVQAGQTYRYAFVGQSRGATFVLNTENGQSPVTFAPALRNPLPLSTAEPNLAEVYVPVSRPAGYVAARATIAARPAGGTVPFTIDLTDSALAGSYQAIFGNQILVDRDSLVSLGAVRRSTVTVRRRRRVYVPNLVDSTLESRTFEYPSADAFPIAGPVTGSATTAMGDTVRTSTWYYGLGFLLVGPDGPIFGTRQLTGPEATPPSALEGPVTPGFSITADNTLASAYNPAGERQIRGTLSLSAERLRAADTVVARSVVDQSMPQWQEALAWRLVPADGTGRYEVSWQDDPCGLAQGVTLDLARPLGTQDELRTALENRAVASVARTDDSTAALLGLEQTELVPLRLPFTVRNVTFDRPVAVAATPREANTVLLGSGADTITVVVPEETWVPGDPLIFIEDIQEEDSAYGGLVLDSLGQPVQRIRPAVSFNRAVLGCDTPRLGCNPVRDGTPGATGYTPMHAGDRTEFEYYAGFRETGAFTFDVQAAVTVGAIRAVTDSALALIRVVPNPFVVYSAYQSSVGEPRIVFTHMPPTGTLRIYTVAAQFVQQITWAAGDLQGDGDLYWDLRTRGGLDAASGLYIWALTAPSDPTDPQSAPVQARGKFVIVR